MASLSQVETEANFLKERLQNLNKLWDGRTCILEMKNNNNPHWRQMEWIGFYGEFVTRKALINQTTINLEGDTFGKVIFDLAGTINWDIKVHPNSAKGAILNDCEAMDLSITKNDFHGLVILCVDCQFDIKGDFKKWHDQLKGGTSDYEYKRVLRGARSRIRKESALLTDVKLILLDKTNIKQLGRAQEGWKNSNGAARKPKYSIKHSQLNL